MEIEGEAFVNTPSGSVSIGKQKSAVNAYCKITRIEGNKEGGQVTVECTADKYRLIKQCGVEFSVAENAPNFIKQAYEYIKTLPEWKDATDC
jgi:hypothetical protein